MDRERLGRYVRERRLQLGLRQSDLGISAAKAGQIERGEDAPMSLATKTKVAQALGWTLASIDDVLDGREPTLVVVSPHGANVERTLIDISDLSSEQRSYLLGVLDTLRGRS